jgi:hypothetical protein
MVKATCTICNKIFTTPAGLKKHQNKKKPCQPTLHFNILPRKTVAVETSAVETVEETVEETVVVDVPAIQMVIFPIEEEEKDKCSVCGEDLNQDDRVLERVCMPCAIETWWDNIHPCHNELKETIDLWFWFTRMQIVQKELLDKYVDYRWYKYWKRKWTRDVLPKIKQIRRLFVFVSKPQTHLKTQTKIKRTIFEFPE